jgi:hypothetical protein
VAKIIINKTIGRRMDPIICVFVFVSIIKRIDNKPQFKNKSDSYKLLNGK